MRNREFFRVVGATLATSLLLSMAAGDAAFFTEKKVYAADSEEIVICDEDNEIVIENIAEDIAQDESAALASDEDMSSMDEEIEIISENEAESEADSIDEAITEELESEYVEPSDHETVEETVEEVEESEDNCYDTSSSSAISVDITAEYYGYSPDEILASINQIRYEACSEGLLYGGRPLTMDDYKPLKWSKEVEEISMKRAAEASIVLGHISPDYTGAFKYFNSKLYDSYGENLAWNSRTDSSAIARGLQQFTDEKDHYISFTKGTWKNGAVNHYLNLINPYYDYVGISGCNIGTSYNGFTTVAMVFVSAKEGAGLTETVEAKSGEQTVRISASVEKIKELYIPEEDNLLSGESLKCSLRAKLGYAYGGKEYIHDCQIPDNSVISWKSSNTNVASVSSNGNITAKKAGNATISASIYGKKASKNLTVEGIPAMINLDYEDSVVFTKGGVVPAITVTDGYTGALLKKNSDYVLKIQKNSNKKPGIMTVVVEGRKSYKGYKETVTIEIKKGDLSKATMTLSDKKYAKTKNSWKSAAKLYDVNGKALTAGVDYEKKLEYSWNDAYAPEPGTEVFVTAYGKGNYEGSKLTGSYRVYLKPLSKCVVKIDNQLYTGDNIELIKEDIHVYANSKDAKAGVEIDRDWFEIYSYVPKYKTGTYNVTLRGFGDYGGTKKCSYKIVKPKKK